MKTYYENIVNGAFLEATKQVLKDVESGKLYPVPQLYLTFRTKGKGVGLPSYLVERFPTEMTIVIQHQYEDLIVGEDKLSLVLSFSGKRERLEIPYSAFISFSDIDNAFSLRFIEILADNQTEEVIENKEKLIDIADFRRTKK